ncbi:hypothetical protein [Sphaerisporangium aureirubrum]|uniref:Uncharacterized protein n=1 Tax=Sphaerisporangium aureirubrum TaxID=1544736 RepID=A0ABW1NNF2_9ACTN
MSERMVRVERDVWIMLVALSPRSVSGWVAGKNSIFDDPEFQRIYLACDQAFDWDPGDERLADLAGAITDWTARRGPEDPGSEPGTLGLIFSRVLDSSPAWRRLVQLLALPVPRPA